MSDETLTKEQKQMLATRFGGCGCKIHCAKEKYTLEEHSNHKPRGRFTVCESEAEELGLVLDGKRADE